MFSTLIKTIREYLSTHQASAPNDVKKIQIKIDEILKNPFLNKITRARAILDYFRDHKNAEPLENKKIFENLRVELKAVISSIRNAQKKTEFSLNERFLSEYFDQPSCALNFPYKATSLKLKIARGGQVLVMSEAERTSFNQDFDRWFSKIVPGESICSEEAQDKVSIFEIRLCTNEVPRTLSHILALLLPQGEMCVWNQASIGIRRFFIDQKLNLEKTNYGAEDSLDEKLILSSDKRSVEFLLTEDFSEKNEDGEPNKLPALSARTRITVGLSLDEKMVLMTSTVELFAWQDPLRTRLQAMIKQLPPDKTTLTTHTIPLNTMPVPTPVRTQFKRSPVPSPRSTRSTASAAAEALAAASALFSAAPSKKRSAESIRGEKTARTASDIQVSDAKRGHVGTVPLSPLGGSELSAIVGSSGHPTPLHSPARTATSDRQTGITPMVRAWTFGFDPTAASSSNADEERVRLDQPTVRKVQF